VIPFAAEKRSKNATAVGRMQGPFVIQCDVAQHEHELIGDLHLIVRVFHQQRPVETESDLRGRHDMRVIPEQSCVGDDEVVRE
jgi:hypothetical protein